MLGLLTAWFIVVLERRIEGTGIITAFTRGLDMRHALSAVRQELHIMAVCALGL